MDKFLRKVILSYISKIASEYQDPEHQKRIEIERAALAHDFEELARLEGINLDELTPDNTSDKFLGKSAEELGVLAFMFRNRTLNSPREKKIIYKALSDYKKYKDIPEELHSVLKSNAFTTEADQIIVEDKSGYQKARVLSPSEYQENPVQFDGVLSRQGIEPIGPPEGDPEYNRWRAAIEPTLQHSTITALPEQSISPDDDIQLRRYYVDPYDPKNSRLSRYYGYWNKDGGERDENGNPSGSWHPTQFNYIVAFMLANAREFGLSNHIDRSIRFETNHPSFMKHPFRASEGYRNLVQPGVTVHPFTEDMEDRIITDFPGIWNQIQKSTWHSGVTKTNNVPGMIEHIIPRRNTSKTTNDGYHIRFVESRPAGGGEAQPAWSVKGPAGATTNTTMFSQYNPEISAANKVKAIVRRKAKESQGIETAVDSMKPIINALIKEINREVPRLNLLRGTDEGKRAVESAIRDAISEIIGEKLKNFLISEER